MAISNSKFPFHLVRDNFVPNISSGVHAKNQDIIGHHAKFQEQNQMLPTAFNSIFCNLCCIISTSSVL